MLPEQTSCEAQWRDEIRSFLLGRLVKNTTVTSIERQHAEELPTLPITQWWLFEGKRYHPLPGPLRLHFPDLERELLRVLATYHPTLLISDQPQAGIDWGRTIALGPRAGAPEYVVQASRTGLSEEERSALIGWARWLDEEWQSYCSRVALQPCGPALRSFVHALGGSASPRTTPALRRWMHITRRSRWPLLRDIVAETLRVYLEPQELERLPLPTDRAHLFELLVLTRAARALAQPAESIRWLDPEATNNTAHVGDVRLRIQKNFGREHVLELGPYQGSLSEALRTFGVRVPSIADIVVELPATTPHGLYGIIIETKSGASEYGAAVEQLTVYRTVIERPRDGARLLVWGVTERGAPVTPEQLAWLRSQLDDGQDDVWAFSSAADIHAVLHTLFGPRARKASRGHAMHRHVGGGEGS